MSNCGEIKSLNFRLKILYEPCFENIGNDASVYVYSMSSNNKGVLPLKVG